MFESLTTAFGSPANAITLFIVIVLAAERLIKGDYLKLRIGKNKERGVKIEEENVPQWAQQLAHHFNHETSEKLHTILESNRHVKEKLNGIERTLNEFDKYGIKIRNGDKK